MKEKKIIDFYMICHRLKNTMRTGWLKWHVDTNRIESVAEHIYGTQMLAIAIKSEYEEYKDLDIVKVIYMLAIHELGETIIGDIAMGDIDVSDKAKLEHQAVHDLLKPLLDSAYIEKIWLEFDNQESNEAVFAHFCDKLECDIQAKIYDETAKVDLTKQDDNNAFNLEMVQEYLAKYQGNKYNWSGAWIKLDQKLLKYPKEFMDISDYVFENEITDNE